MYFRDAQAAEMRRTHQDVSTATIQADGLLQRLRARLEQGISWELKRELVETLVEGAEIDTVETESGREAVVNVRYRFNPFSSDHTGRDSWQQPTVDVRTRKGKIRSLTCDSA